VYRNELEKAESAWDLTKSYDEKLALQPDLDESKKAELRAAFRDDVRTFVAPNFVPKQKKILAVVFHPAAFTAKVKVTDADVAEYYRKHQADYNKKEVRARQILLRIPPKATAEQKKEIMAKLQTILDEIREGKSFAEMARFHSEDMATRGKGGDLGFIAKGVKPPAVDKALFSLEPGEISTVIETPGSYVLLQIEEKRDGRALESVKEEIHALLLKEGSESLARDAAADFADKAFNAVDAALGGEDDDTADKAAVSPQAAAAAFRKSAKAAGLRVQESDFFRQHGVIPPFGYDRDLVSEAFKLTPANPLSDPIKGRNGIYVACWLATKSPEVPKLEGNKALLQRLMTAVRRVRAVAAARKQAGDVYARMRKALAAKKPFAAAAGDTEFKDAEPFTRYRPPAGLPDARKIVEEVRKVPAKTLLAPISVSNGAVLVYLVSRTLPTDEKFAAEKERFEMQLQWMKRRAILDRFYQRLERESDTRLTKAWKPKQKKA
jgi:parvulin-like peptidyl-prolyl isomerase